MMLSGLSGPLIDLFEIECRRYGIVARRTDELFVPYGSPQPAQTDGCKVKGPRRNRVLTPACAGAREKTLEIFSSSPPG
jgi:hypothetical protein